ncbi:hypothetical protein TRIUR3_30599 [Triticum urartu]|uniref:Uncharacterized protein n=1 Tax=Triticum urartu TaxID=4572 RepID=M7ZNP9_TRIUA|nr:hypothetical protein TRIUR3_30599 [Triticum urartu]
MGGGSCDVCKEAPSKYKCPTCRTPYCSVICFKKHKVEFCQKIVPQEETNKPSLQEEVRTDYSNIKDQLPSLSKNPDEDQLPSLAADTTCPAQSPNTVCPTKALEVEDPSWLVDRNRLRSLVELNEVRDALRDSELQKMILQIDGSSEPEKELEKLMEGQAFQQFANKILDIISAQQ